MFAAEVAELLELETSGGGLLVLGRRVVPVLTVRALEGNDFAHDVAPSNVTNHNGWQAVVLGLLLTRRDAGCDGPCNPIS